MPFVLSALSIALPLAAAIPAPVSEVTVFGDRARVVRSAIVTVTGRVRVELPALPSGADAGSVRLEAAAGDVEIDSLEIRPLGPDELPRAEASATLAALEEVDDALARGRREHAALQRIAAVATWRPGGDDGDDAADTADDQDAGARPRAPRLDASAWVAAVKLLGSVAEGAQARARALDQKLGQLQARRETLTASARRMALGSRTGGLRVIASLVGQGRGELRLSYLVAGASWSPAYEVRLDLGSARVSVALAALVSQTTGEDWQSARLAVSTALPVTTTAPPRLAAWRIGQRERFIPTSPAVVEAIAPPPAAPPLVVPASADDRLRNALLLRARADGTNTAPATAAGPDFVESLPHDSRDTIHNQMVGQVAGRIRGGRAEAAAPIGAGRLVGYVFDQTGVQLKGVKVVVRGAIVGGSRTAYTNDDGFFAVNGIAPGMYDVVASAPKLRTYTQKGVVVSQRDGTEVNIIMDVENSAVEEVSVVEKAPLVSTTRANVKETYDVDYSQASLASRPDRTPRQTIALAPPPAYRRPRLAADAPATLAGGHDLSFAALAPETVRSGAGTRRVPLASFVWPVAVERAVYPALATEAFLVAELKSGARHVLPAGPAALFVGGDPAGRATLPLVVPGEPFTLPLGVDRAVRPVRQVTVTTRVEGLLSKQEIERYVVTSEVTNPYRVPMRLRVHDQIPVSPDRSVDVRFEASTPQATRDREGGALAFAVTVAPGKTTTVKFAYTLRRPQGYRLHQ